VGCAGQSSILSIKPSIGPIPDFSINAQKELADKYDNQESVWHIIYPNDCSWYCGGGPYKVEASSVHLTTLNSDNAHDLSFKTAWVGDKGIGDYLTYYFKNKSPRLNEINIYKGYLANDKSWKNYSRAKRIRLYVNGISFRVLDLEDTKAIQSFKVPLLGRRTDGEDLILKFEVTEIYRGDEYKNVALTEIYFNGVDVH